MSAAYDYYIASQEDPQLAEDMFRHHKRSSWESNHAEIAEAKRLAALDQEREEAYHASIANSKGEKPYDLP